MRRLRAIRGFGVRLAGAAHFTAPASVGLLDGGVGDAVVLIRGLRYDLEAFAGQGWECNVENLRPSRRIH